MFELLLFLNAYSKRLVVCTKAWKKNIHTLVSARALVLFLWAILIPHLLARALAIQLFEWYILFGSYVSNTIPQGQLLLRTLLLNLSKFFISIYSTIFTFTRQLSSIVKRYESEDLAVVSVADKSNTPNQLFI